MPTLNDPGKKNLKKTLWKNDKMYATIIFSFTHNDFYPIKE